MEMSINNPALVRRIIRRRREAGADLHDEIWDGVYILSPSANNEHQDLTGRIYIPLELSIGESGIGKVILGANISDRSERWRKNYRCPDVSVFLAGTKSINHGTHWLGGPDFAVEVISPYDRTRKKLGFYARVGTRELLLVDRKPWALELYRLEEGALVLVGKSDLESPEVLASRVVPLSFRLVAGDPRPRVEIAHADGVQRWSA